LTHLDDSKLLQTVHEQVKQIQKDTSSIRDDLSSQQITELLEWISPIDVAAQLKENWKRYQANTGIWFLERPQFRDWVNTPGATLFCPGHPGTGKTIMSTLVIDHLLNMADRPEMAVAYIFLSARNRAQQTADALLLCVLKQLLSATRAISAVNCLKRLQESREKRRRSLTVLSQHVVLAELRILCTGLRNVYMIVDGLDESENSTITSLIAAINTLSTDAVRCVHLMATSRHLPAIQEKFTGMPTIEVRARVEDIKIYLKAQMPHMSGCIRKDDSLQEKIIHGIVKVAKGVFLIARLHVEALSVRRTAKAVKLAIKGFDGSLSDPAAGSTAAYDLAYEASMDRIMTQHTEDSKLAIRVLMWISLSPSTLTITDLQHAMAVECGSVAFDPENMVDGNELMSLCVGLVIIRSDDGMVYLAHHTAQEYFERTRRSWVSDPHRLLAETCVTYLSLDPFLSVNHQYWPFHDGDPDLDENNNARTDESCMAELDSAFPFYEHASRYWAFHTQKIEDRDRVDDAESFLARFLGTPEAVKHANIRAAYAGKSVIHIIESRVGFSGLHFAAMFGLNKLTRALIQDGSSGLRSGYTRRTDHSEYLNNDDMYTPLHIAVYNGHKDVVESLIMLTPEDVDWPAGADFATPLIVAVDHGRSDIVKLLLDTNLANVNGWENHKKTRNFRPLLSAVEGYRQQNHFRDSEARLHVVRTLLDTPGIDKNATDALRTENALHIAARYGTPGIVSLLMVYGLDTNTRNRSGHTPVMIAASLDHIEVVRLLTKLASTSATWQDVEGPEVLMHAIKWRAKSVIEYFLREETVNVMVPNGRSCSVLLALACNADTANVRTLSQRGIALDFKSNGSDTKYFVERVAYSRRNELELMTDVGLDELQRDFSHGGKILLRSLRYRGSREVLKNNIRLDPNIKDRRGATLVSHVARKGYRRLLRRLVDRGGDLVTPDTNGYTPLYWAVIRRQAKTVSYILAVCHDTAANDDKDRTVLNLAQRMYELEMTDDPASLPYWRSPDEEIVDIIISQSVRRTSPVD
jgi:ankyrin repeat protein